MPAPWFALVLALAAPVPVANAPATATGPATRLELAVAAADATLRAAKLKPGTFDYDGAIARSAGLDPDVLVARLDALTSLCPGPCEPLQPHAELLDRLSRAVGQIGSAKHAGSLLRAAERGSFAASQALDRLRMHAMVEALPRARCEPPPAAQVSHAATGIADFMVMRVRSGVLTAEALQPHEREDLAYFLAAVADAGREIGGPVEPTRNARGVGSTPPTPATPATPDPKDQLRKGALVQVQLATNGGDLAGAVAAGRRYLASFGYPAAMDRAADPDQAWGGARHSFVMRDVAELAELTGDITLAHDLFRNADPGGGMCGTSYWSYWRTQVGGVIRTAERLGDCRPVVAERLLDVDVDDNDSAAARRPPFDPCVPDRLGGYGSGSNIWTRPVPALGRRCATSLTLVQSQALTRALLPLIEHRDPQLHGAAIEALGKLAVGATRPTLRKLARTAPKRPCEDEASCVPHYRHRAAVDAVAALDAAPSDRVWHKYDDKRGR